MIRDSLSCKQLFRITNQFTRKKKKIPLAHNFSSYWTAAMLSWIFFTERCKLSEITWTAKHHFHLVVPLQWGAADAEIEVPSGENTELKRSPFKAWSRSVCSHTCFASCQGFFHCLFLPFQSIHLYFFHNLSQFLLCWLWLTHGSCVGLQVKKGHPARWRFPSWVP